MVIGASPAGDPELAVRVALAYAALHFVIVQFGKPGHYSDPYRRFVLELRERHADVKQVMTIVPTAAAGGRP